MTMAACYVNYDILSSQRIASTSTCAVSQQLQQQQQQPRIVIQETQQNKQQTSRLSTIEAALAAATAAASLPTTAATSSSDLNTLKNYSLPLHVDCSVEYELPNQPKPPAGQRIEPLLMIHPCYFRKIESQRRSPFINNMPSSSRNSNSIIVGISSTAQNCNITSSSSSINSTIRRSSTRHQPPPQTIDHYLTRQNTSSQYSSIQLHSHLQRTQHANQEQVSKLSQQGHYPVVSIPSSVANPNSHYIDHASAIRLAAAATSSLNRSHQHSHSTMPTILNQPKSQNHQTNLLVQNSSSSSTTGAQWDQLAAAASIIAPIALPNSSKHHPINISTHKTCSIQSKPSVGKRDAMLSVEYTSIPNNPTSTRIETNRITNNLNKYNPIYNQSSSHISTSLVDTTNIRWNRAASLMINCSPIATVPSNYQAGPDTVPISLHNKQKTNSDNRGNIKNESISIGKYRQHLRSHRIHPYLATDSTATTSATISTISVNQFGGQARPQLSAVPTAAEAITTTPSFQQHLQQISCYNV